jgi:nucleoside-diphosphate-sugar epimerase
MISINDLARMVIGISKKELTVKNISGPLGVRGRNSDNNLYLEKIGWRVSESLKSGIEKTFNWINKQVKAQSQQNVED